ncbi:MAG: hypothetical protein JNL39_22220 [Opitutaceae bacterium]|nr:hypothetical protein [Opitutaceae bacterium]
MHSIPPRQVFSRVAVFLGALLAIFAIALAGLAAVERQVTSEILDDEVKEHGRLLDGALRLAGRPLLMFTETYARRTSLTRAGDVREARSMLSAGARSFEVDHVWVVEADDKLRIQVTRDDLVPVPMPALPVPERRSDRLRYHFVHEGVVFELSGRRLLADGRSPDSPRGWLIAACRLDLEALNPPALPIEGRISLHPIQGGGPPDDAPIRIDRLLLGHDGVPVQRLRLSYTPDELAVISAATHLRTLVMSIFAGVTLVLLAVCLWFWVIRPAGMMHRSLVSEDPAPLEPLLRSGGDFGRLADLVRDLLANRAALRVALEERARLDRDLHDGVIQAIHSSGLGLAQARAVVRERPHEAERLLGLVHGQLTGMLAEVRAMLAGSAPDAATKRSFGEVCAALLQAARAANPQLRTEIDVDETLAAGLVLAWRAQLLQFARECVGNVIRHARATCLTLRLRDLGEGSCLEIVDDGVGFDLQVVAAGRGLRNLAERACALGADLKIDSTPGGGTLVRLTLPRKQHDERDNQGVGGG